jgi:N6-adenosine-specific RNA methylase IME4
LLTWCKTPLGVGLGDVFRLTTEFILFAKRGSLPHKQIIPTTWFNWPRGRHSQKPDAFYAMDESVTPATAATRLDLFAHRRRPRWRTWGNEVNDDDGSSHG